MFGLPATVPLFRTTSFRKKYFYQYNPIQNIHNCEFNLKV